MALCPVCGHPGFLGVATAPQDHWCVDHYPGPLPDAERARFRNQGSAANRIPLGPIKPRKSVPEEQQGQP